MGLPDQRLAHLGVADQRHNGMSRKRRAKVAFIGQTGERGGLLIRHTLSNSHSIALVASCVREGPHVRMATRRWSLSRPSPDSAISSASR